MAMKNWTVRVHTHLGSVELGQVREANEEVARCAALSKFCIPEGEDTDPTRQGIRSEDSFDVSPALD